MHTPDRPNETAVGGKKPTQTGQRMLLTRVTRYTIRACALFSYAAVLACKAAAVRSNRHRSSQLHQLARWDRTQCDQILLHSVTLSTRRDQLRCSVARNYHLPQ